MIDDRCYDSGTYLNDLVSSPYKFAHKPREWSIILSLTTTNQYTLEINGVKFEEMAEAPPRERAALARSAIEMNMDGPKKSAKFALLRKGE